MANTLECEVCHAQAVVHVRDDPPDVPVPIWVCGSCGDLKRWCPQCDQGWIRRFRVEATGEEFFACDHCGATWPSPHAILPPGTDRTSYLQQRGVDPAKGVAQVREQEAVSREPTFPSPGEDS